MLFLRAVKLLVGHFDTLWTLRYWLCYFKLVFNSRVWPAAQDTFLLLWHCPSEMVRVSPSCLLSPLTGQTLSTQIFLLSPEQLLKILAYLLQPSNSSIFSGLKLGFSFFPVHVEIRGQDFSDISMHNLGLPLFLTPFFGFLSWIPYLSGSFLISGSSELFFYSSKDKTFCLSSVHCTMWTGKALSTRTGVMCLSPSLSLCFQQPLWFQPTSG